MDIVGVGGLVLSAAGVVLAIWALIKADGAEKAVSTVIAKSTDQAARDSARELYSKLTEARDAAIARMRGASRLSSAGRSASGDLRLLQLAQDALATTTIATDAAFLASLRASANELNLALGEIHANGDRDGWADALATLQGVIPQIEVWQRQLSMRALQQ